MRELRQIWVIHGNPGSEADRVLALDSDGYLWQTYLLSPPGSPPSVWEAIPGPPDQPPFLDTRDRLTRLEDGIRAQTEERDRIRERMDDLPPIGDGKEAENER